MDEFRRWVDEARGSGVVHPQPPRVKRPDIAFDVGRVTVAQTMNDEHPDVRRAQGMLLAYSPVAPGAVDGIAGPKFDRSVREYQTLKGLARDGIVGEKTWRALEGSD